MFWIGILVGISGISAKVLRIINKKIFIRANKEIPRWFYNHHAYLVIGGICFGVWLLLCYMEKQEKHKDIEQVLKKLIKPYTLFVSVLLVGTVLAFFFIPQVRVLTGRVEVWKAAVDVFEKGSPKDKLIGVGPGSIDLAKDDLEIAWKSKRTLETAHSEIIEYLVSMGIVGCFFYLSIVFNVIYSCFRTKPEDGKAWEIGCCAAAFAAFAGQALTNGPNPVPTVLAFTLVGLLRRYQIPEEDDF